MTAFKEYFGYNEEEEKENTEKCKVEGERKEGGSVSRKSSNLLWEYGEDASQRFDQFEDYVSDKVTKSEASPTPPQDKIKRGIGMDLHIEDEFGDTGLRSCDLSENSSDVTSLYPDKHEYEKAFTTKPGFTLEMQGKSTADIYMELLQTDPALLRETFLKLADKVHSRYTEEVAKGTFIEEDDGSVIFNGSTIDSCKSVSEDSRMNTKNEANKLSTNENNIETAGDIWSKREAGDTGTFRDKCKLERAMDLGVVNKKLNTNEGVTFLKDGNALNTSKNETKEDAEGKEDKYWEMDEEEVRRLQKLRDELWQTYTAAREEQVQTADGRKIQLKEYEEELTRTEEELKKECSGFRQMVELLREDAWRRGEYLGDERPAWRFPSKLADQGYRDYKQQALITRFLTFAALEEQKKEEFNRIKESFVDSDGEEDSDKLSA